MHHRIDDSPDDIDMDLDQRFRPNNGQGGRIILLGDGSEMSNETPDSDMFDHDDEDKDLESQVNKYNKEDANGNASKDQGTTASSQSSTAQVTESPSSVLTEKSDTPEQASKGPDADKKPEASAVQTSEK